MENPAISVFKGALEDLQPGRLVREAVSVSGAGDGSAVTICGNEYPLEAGRGVRLVAAGKASLEMARAAARVLGARLEEGLVITPYEEAEGDGGGSGEEPGLTVLRSAHPVPDERSVAAGRRVREFLQGVPAGSLLIHALSGGTSSLLELPAEGIPVEELNRVYERLNHSGATIREINTVRKHLSQVKGGQLLRLPDPSVRVVDLLLSDVPGDDPAIIGSGPTTPDESTFQDAYHILLEHELWKDLPEAAAQHIERGIDGVAPETVKPGENPLQTHRQHVIGSARKLAERAAERLREEGYAVQVAGQAYNEEARAVARKIAAEVKSVAHGAHGHALSPPAALLFYGESTVQVTGGGKGGRNQELALWGALEIEGLEGVTWLSAGTDGIDGPTDAAGAVVTGRTAAAAREKGLDPEAFLERNDSYHFHEQMDTLLVTGPTGNNLMDLQLVLLEKG